MIDILVRFTNKYLEKQPNLKKKELIKLNNKSQLNRKQTDSVALYCRKIYSHSKKNGFKNS